MKYSALLAVATLSAALSVTAHGQVVLAPTASMTNMVDLTSCVTTATPGVINLDDGVVHTASHLGALVCFGNGYGLVGGYWTSIPGGNFALLNAASGWQRFTFSGPVHAAGAFVNWIASAANDVFISALDASNNVIETQDYSDFDLSGGGTGGGWNTGAFIGFSHVNADIYALEFSGYFPVERNIMYSDPVTESELVTTPEPASLALLATGFVGLAGLARRRRTR